MKKGRSVIVLSIALSGTLGGFWFYGLQQKELLDQGLTISQWLENGDAATPLKALGTDLLPVYIDVLKMRRPKPERFVTQLDCVLPRRLHQMIPVPADSGQDTEKYSVLCALPILGCKASPAMPYVFDLLCAYEEERDLRIFLKAKELFLTMRCKEIMEQLIRELNSNNSRRRAEAAFLLIQYRRAATNPIPSLINGIDREEGSAVLALTAIDPDAPELPERLFRIASSTNSDIASRHACVMALSALGPRAAGMATQVRDLLSKRIVDSAIPEELRSRFGNEKWLTSVITALGNMRRSATVVVPELRALLSDNRCAIRIFAARAIWQITEDPSLVVPVLKATLGSVELHPTFEFDWAIGIPDPLSRASSTDGDAALYRIDELTCRDAAAYLLGEIGPEAKDALPVLASVTVAEDTSFQLLTARAKCRITKNHADFFRLLLDKLGSKVGSMPICMPAAYFLGELGASAESAIPQLEELAKDNNEALRTSAEHALTRIRRAVVEKGDAAR